MPDSWEFYFCNVNNAPASISVDIGVRKSAPDKQRPWLLWVWVHFNAPRPDGLSSSEEAKVLFSIEDELVKTVKATLVGRITTAGRREFYFYGATDKSFETAVRAAMSHFPKYRFDQGMVHQPDWRQYLTLLYPSPRSWQQIKDRHVLETLKKHGDSLQKKRLVSHWAYFASESARQEFSIRLSGQGFEIVSQHQAEKKNDFPYCVQFQRADHVDFQSIPRSPRSCSNGPTSCAANMMGGRLRSRRPEATVVLRGKASVACSESGPTY
jgi:hypothetical protein